MSEFVQEHMISFGIAIFLVAAVLLQIVDGAWIDAIKTLIVGGAFVVFLFLIIEV